MKVKLNGNDFYEVTSQFGHVGGVHPTPHTGIDLAMNIGSHLNSPVDGIISKVVDFGSNNIGKGIYINTDDHQTVIMGHLSSIKAQVGQRVQEGDFIAYSGSTGNSTGGHLHLGMKDADGTFINPEKLIASSDDGMMSRFVRKINHADEPSSIVQNMKDSWGDVNGFWDFIQKWKEVGFFKAMYGKSFFEVIKDFFAELGHDIGIFILHNSEIFFVIPAIVFMGGTWIAGRNKFTKWIIPLWIVYLFSKFLYYVIGG